MSLISEPRPGPEGQQELEHGTTLLRLLAFLPNLGRYQLFREHNMPSEVSDVIASRQRNNCFAGLLQELFKCLISCIGCSAAF